MDACFPNETRLLYLSVKWRPTLILSATDVTCLLNPKLNKNYESTGDELILQLYRKLKS